MGEWLPSKQEALSSNPSIVNNNDNNNNNASLNIIYSFILCEYFFLSLGYISKSKIARSHGKLMFNFQGTARLFYI